MVSSISHSESKIPRRALLLAAVALAAWIASAAYSVFVNPEVRLNVQGATIRRAWAQKMSREHGHKAVVFGGSSCEFSMDGGRALEKYELPLVNFGGPAGMGPAVLAECAIESLQPGDTLIVAVEPGLLTRPFGDPALGVQFSFAMHRTRWLLNPTLGVGRINCFQAAAGLRPGGYHAFTMLGKILTRKPLFRYRLADYEASGWMHTDVREPMTGAAQHGDALSNDGRRLLQGIRSWSDEHQVRIVYSLPWSYSPTNILSSFRQQNAQFLLEVSKYLPVLKDPMLGANPDATLFADTELHLTKDGAAMRTDQLCNALKATEFWTAAELASLAANR